MLKEVILPELAVLYVNDAAAFDKITSQTNTEGNSQVLELFVDTGATVHEQRFAKNANEYFCVYFCLKENNKNSWNLHLFLFLIPKFILNHDIHILYYTLFCRLLQCLHTDSIKVLN